jgi:hypothetical protein
MFGVRIFMGTARFNFGLGHHKEVNSMALESHIRELTDKHSKLDALIQRETKSPSIDDTQLKAMKLQKLRLKQELEDLKNRLN